MVTLSRSVTVLPEPVFLSPQNPSKIIKISPSRIHKFEPRCSIKISGTRIRAVRREESTVLDERDKELETRLNGNVNGNGSGNYAYSNGSVGRYANGSAKVEKENGNLVKYVNGNPNGNVAAKSGVKVVKADDVISGKKKTVEQIGQEDAWFKQKGQDRVEVYRYFCVKLMLC